MLEPVYRADSNSAVRKDMWVRIPPAAPTPAVLDFPCVADPPDVLLCADRQSLGDMYVYLLGIYLGDGCLTLAPKRVWRLRITLDRRYPRLIERCESAINEVSGHVAGRFPRTGCYEVYAHWKHWRCLLPQHGPGVKHTRVIRLEPWQQVLVNAYPVEFLRGLIHSDGCRAINNVHRTWADKSRTYSYPRYFFSNRSDGIREMFIATCAAIGVPARHNGRYSVSVARREGVKILEEVIGPKR